jgi:hypothetical protein
MVTSLQNTSNYKEDLKVNISDGKVSYFLQRQAEYVSDSEFFASIEAKTNNENSEFYKYDYLKSTRDQYIKYIDSSHSSVLTRLSLAQNSWEKSTGSDEEKAALQGISLLQATVILNHIDSFKNSSKNMSVFTFLDTKYSIKDGSSLLSDFFHLNSSETKVEHSDLEISYNNNKISKIKINFKKFQSAGKDLGDGAIEYTISGEGKQDISKHMAELNDNSTSLSEPLSESSLLEKFHFGKNSSKSIKVETGFYCTEEADCHTFIQSTLPYLIRIAKSDEINLQILPVNNISSALIPYEAVNAFLCAGEQDKVAEYINNFVTYSPKYIESQRISSLNPEDKKQLENIGIDSSRFLKCISKEIYIPIEQKYFHWQDKPQNIVTYNGQTLLNPSIEDVKKLIL